MTAVVDVVLERLDSGSPLRGPTLDKAREAYRASVVHARSLKDWRRHEAWVSRYLSFARTVIHESGLQPWTARKLLASNTIIRYYLASVANERKGKGRPASARRALSLARGRLTIPSLNVDASVSDVVKATGKATPTVPNQAQALCASDVTALVSLWMGKADWYSHQMATMVAVGFYRLLRLGELRCIPADGVRYILTNGDEFQAGDSEPAPAAVKTVLLLVCWRKQHNQMYTWIPVSGLRSVTMLLQQRARVRAAKAAFLFPSRVYNRHKRPYMNIRNPMGPTQFIKELRAGLRATVMRGSAYGSQIASTFRGHSLRVGGLNELRRLGVDGETRRLLGGWSSVISQSRYEQLSISERAALSENMGRAPRTTGFDSLASASSADARLLSFSY